MGKNFGIFTVRHFEGILSPAYTMVCCAVGWKKEQGNLESTFVAFPLTKRKRRNMDNGREAEKFDPNMVFPRTQCALLFHLWLDLWP